MKVTLGTIPKDALDPELVNKLENYKQEIFTSDNGTMQYFASRVPSDLSISSLLDSVTQDLDFKELKYLVVIGIGGSNLGAKAIIEACPKQESADSPEVLFLDTLDDTAVTSVASKLNEVDLDEFVICLESNSGSTLESLVNFETLVAGLSEKKEIEEILKRVIVVTSEGSDLHVEADSKGMRVALMPKGLTSRYSVFSASGLLPASLYGLSHEEILGGARSVSENEKNDSWDDSISPREYALRLFREYTAGRKIYDHFVFHPRLASVGKWSQQLMAESLGKNESRQGGEVHAGFLPTVSIGTTALHSMAQYYLANPSEIITEFISFNSGEERNVPAETVLSASEMYKGMNVLDLRNTIYDSVTRSFRDNGNLFSEITGEKIMPFEIGWYMQYKILVTVYLAHLLDIDPFDQPNIEDYKQNVRNSLEKDSLA